ncbi:MAG TPA: DUF4384 domain-containing protein [Gemmatimonadales bacterium]|nr:DUF4384 domain-containing protein [Gemmatimonadales bacterium]
MLSALLTVGGAPGRRPAALSVRARIEVWTDRGEDPYASGQAVRVFFRTDQDAYVTILRVDTDGRVRVLFPREPWEDNFARGGQEYDVAGSHDPHAFYIDDYPGVGYVFGVAAGDPFVYDAIASQDHWDYRAIAGGRVRGDPYVALTDVAQRIVPEGSSDWDYDIAPYYVQRHYDYPRFLCYDCHSYASYPFWSPYDYSCVRFRVVVFDDPYYYPYRSYGGTRVVFNRPLRPEPRFIFKDRQGSEPFVTRVRERPVTDAGRRDVGVRGRDVGGTGVIPLPRGGRPPGRPGTGEGGGERGGGAERGHGRLLRPDRPDQPSRPRSGDTGGRGGGSDRPSRPDRPDGPPRHDAPAPTAAPDRGGRRLARPPEGERRPPAEPRRPTPAPPRPQPPAPAGPERTAPRVVPQRDGSHATPPRDSERKQRHP